VTDEEKIRLWVETWQRAGPELDRIKRDELRRMRHEDVAHIIDALFEIGCQFAVPRTSSGLVEQQRLFGKLPR
jgi:hypothetical protein